jgi:hypothetical protein
MTDIPDRSSDPPMCWEIGKCCDCPDKGTLECPEYEEEEDDGKSRL